MRNRSTSQNRPAQNVKAKTAGSYIKGLPLIFLCLVMLLALSEMGYGRVNELLASALRWLVGSGSYLLALLIGIQGWFILRGHSWRTYVSRGQVLSFELIILCALGIWTLHHNETLALYPDIIKNSGGLLGWPIAFLVSFFGVTIGKVLLSLCILLLLPPLFRLPLMRIQSLLLRQQQKVNRWQSALELPAPTNRSKLAPSPTAQQSTPSPARSPVTSKHEYRAKRVTTPSSTRLSTNQPVQQPAQRTSTEPVSRPKSLDPLSTQSAYRASSPATRPLPNWVTDEVMPPIGQKEKAEPISPVQAANVSSNPPKQSKISQQAPPPKARPARASQPRMSQQARPPKAQPARASQPRTSQQARPPKAQSARASRSQMSQQAQRPTSRPARASQPKTSQQAQPPKAQPATSRPARASQPKTSQQASSATSRPTRASQPETSQQAQPPKAQPATSRPARASQPETSQQVAPPQAQQTQAARPKKKTKVQPAKQSAPTVPAATEIDPPPVRKINTIVPVSVTNQPRQDDLPPFDILLQHSGKVDPLEAQEKARLIEETLEHFGVPATVVEINQGPRITQFGVEPGFIETFQRDGSVKRRKVKVNAIKALSDDLALALAARSIRIQSRVPGRTYVGIELPNDEFETVTLHSVLTSQAYQKIKGDLVIALGRDVTGQPVAADISRMPHMLIAGATGSGKSVCINAIIASLLFNLSPEQLKLLLIDPKMVELVPYNGIPHLHMPVVTNMEKVVGSLSWAVGEMERRYNLFSQARKRNLQSYNKWAKGNGQEPLPYVVIIIDELADLMMVAADEVEQIICRLAQMARATGMHLILATQRPSVDVVTGLIKANIPTRVSFAVASGTDSRVILDSTGAEDLLGLGDMLYQASDASRLQRIQGCYVSDDELQELVDYWLHAKAKKALSQILQEKPSAKANSPKQQTPKGVSQESSQKDENLDELLAKAIALVEQNQSISISMLQRKLRISYTRAAQMIKELKKQGVIGAGKK